MPYKIKTVAKKSVLEPEAIMSRSQDMLDQLYIHRRWLALGVSLVLVVGIAWGGVAWFQADQDRKAAIIEYQASKEVSGVPPTDPNRQAGYQKAAELYQELLTKFPRSSSAPFAQFQLGNAYFELKQYDKAISAYQDFIQRYKSHETLLPAVYLRLGYVHLYHGDSQAALANFDQVIQYPEAWNKGQAYYEAGRVYEKLGDKMTAIGKYEGLVKEFPKSSWAREAQTRLRVLGVFQQPTPPASGDSPLPQVTPEAHP